MDVVPLEHPPNSNGHPHRSEVLGYLFDGGRQPFRSMGFVSIIIVSVLFTLGLPLVLL